MKKLILLLVFCSIAHAQNAKLSVEIKNPNSDSIALKKIDTGKSTVFRGKSGKFKIDFTVESGFYQFYDGGEYTTLYLRPGFDLKMTLDTQQFDETIVYTGKGANENNFLAKDALAEEVYGEKMRELATKRDMAALMALRTSRKEAEAAALKNPSISDEFRSDLKKKEAAELDNYRKTKSERDEADKRKQETIASLEKKPSPGFVYENAKGGTTSLESLRGHYVYIDVWATWCGPCRAEIPHLQKVEEKCHGKNIEFVSISIDVARDHEKWKKMVQEKQLGGIQLFADKDWKSEFIAAYAINSIPRFILIDPYGAIIDADAARPSHPELDAQLETLLK